MTYSYTLDDVRFFASTLALFWAVFTLVLALIFYGFSHTTAISALTKAMTAFPAALLLTFVTLFTPIPVVVATWVVFLGVPALGLLLALRRRRRRRVEEALDAHAEMLGAAT